MATTAPALVFGQQLFTSLLQAGTIGPTAAAVQAVISPLSVYFALVLLLNGAGPLSVTQQELWQAVGPPLPAGAKSQSALATAAAAFNNATSVLQTRLKKQAGGGIQLVIANAIWTKDVAIKPAYAEKMRSLYDAQVQSVSSAAPINAWAAAVTNRLITQAVPPNIKFNVLITNAVYFKALFEYPFSTQSTRKQSFAAITSGGSAKVVQVDMMSRTFKPRELRGTQPIRYGEIAKEWRGIRLPYKGSPGLAAVAVLPDAAKYSDVYAAAAAFKLEQLFDRKGDQWASLFDVGALSVSLPRFKVAVSQLSLTKALKGMGISAAFNPKQADFSSMADEDLVVSDVLQSAVVLVDESGTEAAAVTSVVMTTTAFTPDTTPPLVFDRPFLFFLVDDVTRTVLFQGVVTDPSKN